MMSQNSQYSIPLPNRENPAGIGSDSGTATVEDHFLKQPLVSPTHLAVSKEEMV